MKNQEQKPKRKSEYVVTAVWILKTDDEKLSFAKGEMIPTELNCEVKE